MLNGLETVALTKRQDAEMDVAELKMLRFSLGVTRRYTIRNEYIMQMVSAGGMVCGYDERGYHSDGSDGGGCRR